MELRDLLHAEGSATKRHTSVIGLHDAIPLGTLRPVREKTQDTKERLHRAMDVFLEDVVTTVPMETPRQRPFVQVVRSIRGSADSSTDLFL